MGSNESFPPPPPPGQPPQPNWPPQQPGFQPTQQMPTTAYPQPAFTPGAGAPKKGNGLLIGGGLVVAAVLIGGVVLLAGGDDDKKSTITLAPITSTTDATATTIGVTVPVITLAPTVPGSDTPPTSADDSLVEIFDDSGTFSMILPNDLELDTTSFVSSEGYNVPRITAANSVAGYNADDVTFGLSTFVVGPDIGSDQAQVMAFLEPVDGACTGRVQDTVQTLAGLATRVSLEGCGVGGGNKVLLVAQLADRPIVLGLYIQGTAAIVDLALAGQYALESILVF